MKCPNCAFLEAAVRVPMAGTIYTCKLQGNMPHADCRFFKQAQQEKKKKIYVASSWRNQYQHNVVQGLRDAGYDVYDFKNPRPGNHGFKWSEIDEHWQHWHTSHYVEALKHPVAVSGFSSDLEAMKAADACVLVMPCGRSAHIEAGYFVGAGKPLIILIYEKCEPELMYKMATAICVSIASVIDKLESK